MSNSFRSSRFIYKFAEPVITGEEGEEIIVQKDAISTIEVVALMMVAVMTNITMLMMKMVTNTIDADYSGCSGDLPRFLI